MDFAASAHRGRALGHRQRTGVRRKAMTDENRIERQRLDAAEVADELSDDALDRPPVGSAFICLGICGSE